MSAFHLLSVESSTRGGFDSLLVYVFLFRGHPLLDRTFTLPLMHAFAEVRSVIARVHWPQEFWRAISLRLGSKCSAATHSGWFAYAARQQTRIHCGGSRSSFTGYMHSLRSSDCLLVIEEKHPITSGPTFYPSR